ncbi:MAG: hypothetical protein Q8N84_01030 [bacterium]|nr:hypothetical protein [bacterium]
MFFIFHDSSFLVPQGTSPQEIENKVIGQRLLYGQIVLFAMFSTSLIMHLFVSPKLIKLYQELGFPVPWMTQYGVIFPLIITCFLWLVFRSQVGKASPAVGGLYTSVKTEEGFLRVTPRVTGRRLEMLIMLGLGLTVGFLVYSIIVPIYSLTNQF